MTCQNDLREKALAFITSEGVTRTHICKKILLTPGAFSMWLKGARQLGKDKEKVLTEFLEEKLKSKKLK